MMHQIEISFQHNLNRLAGTLSYPKTGGPHPAIIMLQGSGAADRTNDHYFPPIRDYLVGQGVAVLCYDKPGTGGSSGDWQQQSFVDRADEALAAVDHLRTQGMIDANRIGLFGHSQGGWIVFLAASISDDVAFIISNSGPGIRPWEQDRFGIEYLNRSLGCSKHEIESALACHADVVALARRDASYDELDIVIVAKRNVAWDNYFVFTPESWGFFKRNFDYDPLPVIRQVDCPVLALFGAEDLLVPAQQSAKVFKEVLAEGHNPELTVEIFADADHRIKVNQATDLAPGYLEVLGGWLIRNC